MEFEKLGIENIELYPGERLDTINEDLCLIQKTNGLTFGTDAYLLSAFLRHSAHAKGAELGGGTGVLSLLALSKNKVSTVQVYEIQPEFALLCHRNAVQNGLSDRMQVCEGDVRTIVGNAALDVVFSNPPYMTATCGKENRDTEMNIARREIHGDIGDFCAAADRLLRHGGYFSVVYRPERLSDLLTALRGNHLEAKRVVLVYPSMQDRPCLVLVEAKKGASPGIVLAPPLCIYTGADKKTYTPEMAQIYETGSMDFLFPGTKRSGKKLQACTDQNDHKQQHTGTDQEGVNHANTKENDR